MVSDIGEILPSSADRIMAAVEAKQDRRGHVVRFPCAKRASPIEAHVRQAGLPRLHVTKSERSGRPSPTF
jgi:hypothetical protein